eukprot:ctg_445.g236
MRQSHRMLFGARQRFGGHRLPLQHLIARAASTAHFPSTRHAIRFVSKYAVLSAGCVCNILGVADDRFGVGGAVALFRVLGCTLPTRRGDGRSDGAETGGGAETHRARRSKTAARSESGGAGAVVEGGVATGQPRTHGDAPGGVRVVYAGVSVAGATVPRSHCSSLAVCACRIHRARHAPRRARRRPARCRFHVCLHALLHDVTRAGQQTRRPRGTARHAILHSATKMKC